MSRSHWQCIDAISFISQQQALVSRLKDESSLHYTVMLSVMEIVQCAVNCTFRGSFSHELVMKPNQPNQIFFPLSLPYFRRHFRPAGLVQHPLHVLLALHPSVDVAGILPRLGKDLSQQAKKYESIKIKGGVLKIHLTNRIQSEDSSSSSSSSHSNSSKKNPEMAIATRTAAEVVATATATITTTAVTATATTTAAVFQ